MKRTDYISWDEYFMGIAMLSAQRSKDNSTQVGACIVNKENKIINKFQRKYIKYLNKFSKYEEIYNLEIILKNIIDEISFLIMILFGIILIIAGAIGNLIDRVRLGFVVDYFDFRFIWEYVFNVADIYVTCGSALFILIFLFSKGDIFRWK